MGKSKKEKKNKGKENLDELAQIFEEQQKRFGTKVAIFNLLWIVAADLMGLIGVKCIRTSTRGLAKGEYSEVGKF